MSTEFHELAAARAAHLYRSAWLLCGDAHTAEDLVQDTLEKVYVRMSRRFAPKIDNPAAYAQTTLVRTFISGRRRRSSGERPAAEHADGTAGTEPGPPHLDEDTALRLSLTEALDGLQPLDRAVLVLRFLDDLQVSEVANLLDVTPAAVRSRSYRALARLRLVLGPSLPDLLNS